MTSNAADSEIQSVPNHSIDPATGYIESNGFMEAFNAPKKTAFLALFKQNKLRFWRTCAELGVKGDTVQIHLNMDSQFKADYEQTKREYFDNLEGTSRENAENPRSVIERIFQLKAAFPEKYGDGKRESGTIVNITIDADVIKKAQERRQIVEGQIVSESMGLSAKIQGDNVEMPHKPPQSTITTDTQPLS